MAACGVPVVKHGNRAASGRSGSSDVLAALGVATDLEPAVLAPLPGRAQDRLPVRPQVPPRLGRVAPVRRQLPFRTIFNLVGPLCNPGRPVPPTGRRAERDQAELVAQVLSRQEHIRRAVVVTGCDGLDEVTLDGPTQVRVIEAGRVRTEVWMPEDFGLIARARWRSRSATPSESAAKTERGVRGRERAGARLRTGQQCGRALGGRAVFVARGDGPAASAIDSGAAAALLDRWRQLAPVPLAVGQPTLANGSPYRHRKRARVGEGCHLGADPSRLTPRDRSSHRVFVNRVAAGFMPRI